MTIVEANITLIDEASKHEEEGMHLLSISGQILFPFQDKGYNEEGSFCFAIIGEPGKFTDAYWKRTYLKTISEEKLRADIKEAFRIFKKFKETGERE